MQNRFSLIFFIFIFSTYWTKAQQVQAFTEEDSLFVTQPDAWLMDAPGGKGDTLGAMMLGFTVKVSQPLADHAGWRQVWFSTEAGNIPLNVESNPLLPFGNFSPREGTTQWTGFIQEAKLGRITPYESNWQELFPTPDLPINFKKIFYQGWFGIPSHAKLCDRVERLEFFPCGMTFHGWDIDWVTFINTHIQEINPREFRISSIRQRSATIGNNFQYDFPAPTLEILLTVSENYDSIRISAGNHHVTLYAADGKNIFIINGDKVPVRPDINYLEVNNYYRDPIQPDTVKSTGYWKKGTVVYAIDGQSFRTLRNGKMDYWYVVNSFTPTQFGSWVHGSELRPATEVELMQSVIPLQTLPVPESWKTDTLRGTSGPGHPLIPKGAPAWIVFHSGFADYGVPGFGRARFIVLTAQNNLENWSFGGIEIFPESPWRNGLIKGKHNTANIYILSETEFEWSPPIEFFRSDFQIPNIRFTAP